jgi:thiol:disulfide interchange protein DsbD
MADVNAVTPGLTFHLAFIFDIEPGWHIYWKNAGASGGPTTISVSGPADFKIGRILYPRPHAIESEEGTTYGYEKQVVLFVEVTAPSMLTNGHITFNARVDWMVCKDVCLLGRTSQVMHVITAEGDGGKLLPPLHPIDPLIATTRSRLPKPLESVSNATATYADGTLTISLPAAGFSTAQFFPDQTPGVTYDSPAVSKEDDRLVLTVPITVRPNNALGKPLRIAGTVGLGDRQTDPCYDFEIPLPAP